MGPITPVRWLWLRGVTLGWMSCMLLAQRDRTKEGTVTEIEQNTRFLLVHGTAPFIFPVQSKVLPVQTSICRSNGTSVEHQKQALTVVHFPFRLLVPRLLLHMLMGGEKSSLAQIAFTSWLWSLVSVATLFCAGCSSMVAAVVVCHS